MLQRIIVGVLVSIKTSERSEELGHIICRYLLPLELSSVILSGRNAWVLPLQTRLDHEYITSTHPGIWTGL